MRTCIFSVILVACLTSISDGQQMVIQPAGSEQIRPLRGNIVFTCTVLHSDESTSTRLKWVNRLNVSIEREQGRVYIERVPSNPSTLKLYITAIEDGDAGTYTCQEWSYDRTSGRDLAIVQQMKTRLEIYKDITFDGCAQNQNPVIHTHTLIQCRVSGSPTPTVNWRFKGTPINTEDPRYEYAAEGLRVKNITQSDNGMYTCSAEVPADGRYDKRDIFVEVHIKPKMVSGIGGENGGRKEAIGGYNVDIKCAATGHPQPRVEFYKDDDPVKLGDTGFGRRRVDEASGTIYFRPLIKADEGNYRCVGVNAAGSDEINGELFVIVAPNIPRFPNETKREGETAQLSCYAEGDPPPNLTWRKFGSNKDYDAGDNDGGRIQVIKVSERRTNLVINNVHMRDTHNYTCYARNTGGVANMTGQIVAEFKPRFSPDHPTTMYNWRTRTRNMTCRPEAEPVPLITWHHRGELISGENETFRQFPRIGERSRESKLQITVRERDEHWIFGVYTCRANNKYGSTDLPIMLKQADVPSIPKNAEVLDGSPTMVHISVVPPDSDGGMPIYGYRVEYDNKLQDFNLDEQIIIENLSPKTTYVFMIRAKNEVGVGAPFPLNHQTNPYSPPLEIIVISDPNGMYPYSYVLRWEKPRTGGLPILEYIFQRRRVLVHEGTFNVKEVQGPFVETRVLDNTDAPMLFYEFKNLQQHQAYELTIVARNNMGPSKATIFVFRTAQDDGYNFRPIVGGGSTQLHSLRGSCIIFLLSALLSALFC